MLIEFRILPGDSIAREEQCPFPVERENYNLDYEKG